MTNAVFDSGVHTARGRATGGLGWAERVRDNVCLLEELEDAKPRNIGVSDLLKGALVCEVFVAGEAGADVFEA